jgi:hypothetical protein
MSTAGPTSRAQAGAPLTEFFIVGCPRSGTTLLRWMLDAHPCVAVTPETHFGDHYVNDRDRFGRDGDPAARRALIHEFCASQGFRAMGIDGREFRVAAMSDPNDPWLPLRVAMFEFAGLRKVTIVGEKTPSHALYLKAIAEAFPAARFLFMRRDPRAVAASWLRTTWSTETSVEVAEKWRRYAQSMCQAYRVLPGRCLELRYEELVSTPRTVLESVCAFLGTAFDPGMLSYYERARDIAPDASSPDEGLDNALTFAPPDPSRIDAWRKEATVRDVRRVEAICGRLMVECGYELDTSMCERLPGSIALLAPLWRKRARRKLRAHRTGSL